MLRILSFLVILIVITAFIATPCYLAYKEVEDFTVGELQKSAQGTAVATAVLIEQELPAFKELVSVEDYSTGIYDVAYYQKMLAFFHEIKMATNATFVYAEKKASDTEIVYIFDGEEINSEKFSALGDRELSSSAERFVLKMGVPATTGIEEDQGWGYSLSGFAPVTEPITGEVIAIVGVDYAATYVHDSLRKILEVFFVGAFVGILLVYLLVLRLLKNSFRKQETDYVTGLRNRHFYEVQLRNFIRQMRLSNRTLSLIMIDLDQLKNINDTYGHSMGDKALDGVAEILRIQTRNSDICSRYGGDEFVAALPDADILQASCIAERIRSGVEELVFQDESDRQFSITISIGVAEWKKGMRAETLAGNADEALYQSKNNGRNTVTCYDSAICL